MRNSSYSVAEARAALPKVINDAKRGKVIEITRRGRPEAVVMSLDEYHRLTSAAARPTFMERYGDWRSRVDPGELDFAPGFLEGLRDRSPGPSPCFDEVVAPGPKRRRSPTDSKERE